MHILAGIMSLMQYMEQYHDDKTAGLGCCPRCNRANPWRHGCYPRKSDRLNPPGESLNPVLIQRYYCPGCKKTCSVLPECIPPHRWYLWEIQQIALSLLLVGKSLRAIAQQIMPSRHTIARWMNRFKEQLVIHKDTLCNYIIDLGRTTDFTGFWQASLSHFSLAQAMRLCHVAGISIP